MSFSPNARRGKKDFGKTEFREGNPKAGKKAKDKKSDSAASNGSANNPTREKESETSPRTTEVNVPSQTQQNAPKEEISQPSTPVVDNKPSGPPLILNPKENTLMFDRLLWIIMNLVGKQVEVQVKSGDIFEGVLHTANTEKGIGIILKMARKKDPKADKKEVSVTRPIPSFIIYPSDFVQLYAKDVSFEVRSEREFATDTDISGHSSMRERELQPWVPSDDIDTPVDLSLESKGKTNWDQFEVNKQLFGVETSWDERIYTTEIRKEGLSEDEWRQRTREAARIAQEIEKSAKSATNTHLAEERGIEVDMDEEERYGAVIREAPTVTATLAKDSTTFGKDNKYIPPGRRLAMEKEKKEKEEKEKTVVKQEDNKPKEEIKVKEESNLKKEVTKMKEEKKLKEEDGTIKMPAIAPISSAGLSTPTSPRSPRSPRSPLRSPGAAGELVSERLRIRHHLVSERFKSTAPVPEKSPSASENFPNMVTRSPLMSPLIGDPRSIVALSLEPGNPAVEESVLHDFYQFSLQAKKEKQESDRDRTIAAFKDFSLSMEKKVTNKSPSASPTTVRKSTPSTQQSPVATRREIPPFKGAQTTKASTPPTVKTTEKATKETVSPSVKIQVQKPTENVGTPSVPPSTTSVAVAPTSTPPVVPTTTPSSTPSTTPSSTPSTTPSVTPVVATPIATPVVTPVVPLASGSTSSSTTPSTTPIISPVVVKPTPPPPKEEKAIPTPPEKIPTPPISKETNKLNPNAKIFKPMSASAPSFTPSTTPPTAVPIPIAPQGEYVYGRPSYEDPFMYAQRAMFTAVPYGPQAIPVPSMYPQTVRILPNPGPSYTYSNGQQYQYSPPVVYQPGHQPHTTTKRHLIAKGVPPGNPPPPPEEEDVEGKYQPVAFFPGPASPTVQHIPHFIGATPARGVPYYAYPGAPPMVVQPMDAGFGPSRIPTQQPQHIQETTPKEGLVKSSPPSSQIKEESKFTGVPNTDTFHGSSSSSSQKEEKKSKE